MKLSLLKHFFRNFIRIHPVLLLKLYFSIEAITFDAFSISKAISGHIYQDTTICFYSKHDSKPSHSKCLSYLQTAECALIFHRASKSVDAITKVNRLFQCGTRWHDIIRIYLSGASAAFLAFLVLYLERAQ